LTLAANLLTLMDNRHAWGKPCFRMLSLKPERRLVAESGRTAYWRRPKVACAAGTSKCGGGICNDQGI
jgi:hypothetical protein